MTILNEKRFIEKQQLLILLLYLTLQRTIHKTTVKQCHKNDRCYSIKEQRFVKTH